MASIDSDSIESSSGHDSIQESSNYLQNQVNQISVFPKIEEEKEEVVE